MLTKILLFALALCLHSIATQSASLLDLGLGALGQLQNGNGNGNGYNDNGSDDESSSTEEESSSEESEEREVNPFHKLNTMQEGTEFPYLWPKFPFVPGLNFPPNYPPWMLARRPTGVPDVVRMALPHLNMPWANGDDDDSEESDSEESDSDEDIEECPDDGIKFISHPENCDQFILCVDGEEVSELDCPDGEHFSRDDRMCMDPDDAGCE